MRLINAWLGNNAEPVATAKGRRYQVRWLLSPGAGRLPIERKRTTFSTKAEARLFLERLTKAEYEVEGWRFGDDGQPTSEPRRSTSVFAALESYVKSRWDTHWQVSQRTKARMRLVELVVLTLDSARDVSVLLRLLEEQRPDRRRCEPTTSLEWVARYLRDYGLRPDGAELSAHLESARRWLEAHSIPLAALSIDRVTELRGHFTRADLAPKTARTYWSGTVLPFLTWLVDTDQIARSVVKAQPRLRRDVGDERPDPRRIPDPPLMEEVAVYFAERHGAIWGTYVRLSTFCSLRISEAFDVRWTSFVEKRGRLFLVVATQQRRVTGVNSDDGETLVRTGTKSTRDRHARVREVPLPKALADEVRALARERLGRDSSLLFVGPRGSAAPADTVRNWWREAVDAVLVPKSSTLAGITPHSMRHAGMTYWFAQGVDHKRIQLWGGWSSLVQMLDTYRGVLDSLEAVDLAGIDGLGWGGVANIDLVIDDANPRVVDLNQWRARRRQGA